MKKLYRRSISGLLALLICFTAILGSSHVLCICRKYLILMCDECVLYMY